MTDHNSTDPDARVAVDPLVRMVINCGFCRRKSRGFEHRNVTGITVYGLSREDGPAIRRELMKHAPNGDGWSIAGYFFVSF